jgi:hypothetical protein
VAADPYEIQIDVLWPREPAYRYRLYARDDDGLHVLAATDCPEGIGSAIARIHEDQKEVGRRLCDLGVIGVLDVLPGGEPHPKGEWLVLPWPRSREPRPSRAVS